MRLFSCPLPILVVLLGIGCGQGQIGSDSYADYHDLNGSVAEDEALKGGVPARQDRDETTTATRETCGAIPIQSVEFISPIHILANVDETPYAYEVENPYYPDESSDPSYTMYTRSPDRWKLVELNPDGTESGEVVNYPRGIPFGYEWEYVLFHVHFENLKPNSNYRLYLYSGCLERVKNSYVNSTRISEPVDFQTGSLVPETISPEIQNSFVGLNFIARAAAVEAYDDTSISYSHFAFYGDFSAAGNLTGIHESTLEYTSPRPWPEKVIAPNHVNDYKPTTLGGNLIYANIPNGTTSYEITVGDVFGNDVTIREDY